MSEGPPSAADAPGAQAQAPRQGTLLLALVPGLIQTTAQHAERLSALERTTGDYASRTDGRMSAFGQQIAHLEDRLDQQDQSQAAFRAEVKSQLGTLVAAEAKRQQTAEEQARAQQEQARAIAAARSEVRNRFRLFFLALPGLALGVADALRLSGSRLLVAVGVGLALALAVIIVDYVRSPKP